MCCIGLSAEQQPRPPRPRADTVALLATYHALRPVGGRQRDRREKNRRIYLRRLTRKVAVTAAADEAGVFVAGSPPGLSVVKQFKGEAGTAAADTAAINAASALRLGGGLNGVAPSLIVDDDVEAIVARWLAVL